MTGLENLKQEIISRGGTKQMAESKVVALVLDIIANNGKDDYLREYEIRTKLSKHDYDIMERERAAWAKQYAAEQKEAELKRREKAIAGIEEKIEAFNKQLMECETPEGRDAMRTAQFFMNVAYCETSQNRTAFINGLAAILSRTPLSIPFEPIKIDTSEAHRTPKAGHR